MKVIKLKHSSKVHATEKVKTHSDKCELHKRDGNYIIYCRCDTAEVKKESKKEVRKDIIDEIDTNGNGRITKKEIKDFINKDK